MEIIKGDEGKCSGEIAPKDMQRGTRVLGRTNDVHHQGVKGKGWGDVDLNNDQGVMMDCGMALKVMERTDQKGGCSKSGV